MADPANLVESPKLLPYKRWLKPGILQLLYYAAPDRGEPKRYMTSLKKFRSGRDRIGAFRVPVLYAGYVIGETSARLNIQSRDGVHLRPVKIPDQSGSIRKIMENHIVFHPEHIIVIRIENVPRLLERLIVRELHPFRPKQCIATLEQIGATERPRQNFVIGA